MIRTIVITSSTSVKGIFNGYPLNVRVFNKFLGTEPEEASELLILPVIFHSSKCGNMSCIDAEPSGWKVVAEL